MKPTITIEYCPRCGWLFRAAYISQELLTTFCNELNAISLNPGKINGSLLISINDNNIFDRAEYGRFPEIKELKQVVRDIVSPGRNLGHTDSKPQHIH